MTIPFHKVFNGLKRILLKSKTKLCWLDELLALLTLDDDELSATTASGILHAVCAQSVLDPVDHDITPPLAPS